VDCLGTWDLEKVGNTVGQAGGQSGLFQKENGKRNHSHDHELFVDRLNNLHNLLLLAKALPRRHQLPVSENTGRRSHPKGWSRVRAQTVFHEQRFKPPNWHTMVAPPLCSSNKVVREALRAAWLQEKVTYMFHLVDNKLHYQSKYKDNGSEGCDGQYICSEVSLTMTFAALIYKVNSN
jgi:hypothetical protein